MNQLTQSLEREGSSRFVFLSRGLAFLARPSVAVWAAIPLRLIVGYGFMEHGFAKLSKGPENFAAILHTMGVPAPHGMAHHSDRAHRRSRRPARSFRRTCKSADGCGSRGSDADRPSPLWVQLDQAAECDVRPGPVRAAGLRA